MMKILYYDLKALLSMQHKDTRPNTIENLGASSGAKKVNDR